ncbi:hypothetical protein DF058_17690 [Burkholderia cenocepacia]|nr:hypothetical protein DF058_17690 [Burkholderia cenocepacia]RRA14448.1 hypothetical protein DF059_17840 [Burkholderia cenocepacia]
MDKPRCRPGDLAIVTKCTAVEHIGLLVRVIEHTAIDGHDWIVEIQGQPIMSRSVHGNKMCLCRTVIACDWNLTPIRGDTSFDIPHTHEEKGIHDDTGVRA